MSTREALNAQHLAELDYVRARYTDILNQIRQLIQVDLKALEQRAEQAGVPWTAGRFPQPPSA